MKQITGIDYIGVTMNFYCIDGKGKILLHKRGKACRDEVSRWDNGGGQLEFGETPEHGVLREIREELGCKATILEQIPAISAIRIQNGIKTHWLAIGFIVRVNPKDVKIMEKDKIDDIGWFTLANLPHPLHSAFRRYILQTDRIKYLKKYVKG